MLFNGAETFEQIVDTLSTEGSLWNLVKIAQAVPEKKTFKITQFYTVYVAQCRDMPIFLNVSRISSIIFWYGNVRRWRCLNVVLNVTRDNVTSVLCTPLKINRKEPGRSEIVWPKPVLMHLLTSKFREMCCKMETDNIGKEYKYTKEIITKTGLFKYTKNLPPKNETFQIKSSDIFHISAQNIDCGYSLEPPHRGGSNEYPQSMFWAEIKKITYTPVNPSFTT